MPFAGTWMDLQSVILSEVSQTKTNYHMTLYVESKTKWYKGTYLQNRNRVADVEKKTCGYQRGSGGRDKLGD